MKSRAIWSALVVSVVSLTSGCHCFHNCFHNTFPNVGWRFHQHGCGGCMPACAPACSAPVVVGSGPVVPGGPACHGCASGELPPTVTHQPAGYQPAGYPPVGYPPVIGHPMPLPGPTVIPSNELPTPMPVKKGGN